MKSVPADDFGPHAHTHGGMTDVAPAPRTHGHASMAMAPGAGRDYVGCVVATILVAAAVLLAHGWSLNDGLSLDDHWHYYSVPRADWTIRDLLSATTLDAAEQVRLWWQEKDVRFVYARPVAVALLKVTYALSGNDPFAAHAVSLALHFTAAMLVYVLCRRLTGARRWALAGGLAFALYPHTVYAAGWLAAQNIVLQTVLMLAALLCYVRASGLELSPAASGDDDLGLPFPRTVHQSPSLPGSGSGRVKAGPFVLALVFWVAALFSRENAIMLPGIVVAFDLAFGGWRRVWARIPAYLVFAAIGLAFLIWRLKFFYEPMPDVYVQRSGGEGYFLWCVAKLFHYLCTALTPTPMTVGPSGRYEPFREAPLDMAAMIALVIMVLGLYVLAARRARGFWIWPLWVLLAIVPVIPVLATPHSGYLCGVAVAAGLAIACDRLGHSDLRRWRRTAHVLAIFVVLSYVVSMKIGRLLWMGMVYAEQYTMMGMKAFPPPDAAQQVFLLNVPFTGIYAKRCLAEQEGPRIDAMDFHVLTFAPYIMRMDKMSALVQTDDHAFTLQIDDARYFSGLLGRFLIAGFREPCPFVTGQTFDAGEYTVEVLDADDEGVRRLGFRFSRRLDDPRYCFYVSSYECGAVRLAFSNPPARQPLPDPPSLAGAVHDAADAVLDDGDVAAAGIVFAALTSTNVAVRETAEEAMDLHIADVANALAAPVQGLLAMEEPLAPHAEALWTWWQQEVSAEELVQVHHNAAWSRKIRHRRDEIHRARALARRYVRTDLLLSDHPYPSLRPDPDACR